MNIVGNILSLKLAKIHFCYCIAIVFIIATYLLVEGKSKNGAMPILILLPTVVIFLADFPISVLLYDLIRPVDLENWKVALVYCIGGTFYWYIVGYIIEKLRLVIKSTLEGRRQ